MNPFVFFFFLHFLCVCFYEQICRRMVYQPFNFPSKFNFECSPLTVRLFTKIKCSRYARMPHTVQQQFGFNDSFKVNNRLDNLKIRQFDCGLIAREVMKVYSKYLSIFCHFFLSSHPRKVGLSYVRLPIEIARFLRFRPGRMPNFSSSAPPSIARQMASPKQTRNT